MPLRTTATLLLPPFLAVLSSLLLNRLTGHDNNGWILSLLFLALIQFILVFLYKRRILQPDFPSFLLACVVVRLILCLVLLVILSVVAGDFVNLAFHLLLQFLIFTIAEILYVSQKMKPVKASHNQKT